MEFTIQAMQNSTDISYVLTGYQDIVIYDTLFTIFLSDNDLDAIDNLAVSVDTTYLSFKPQGITNASQATLFINDMSLLLICLKSILIFKSSPFISQKRLVLKHSISL